MTNEAPSVAREFTFTEANFALIRQFVSEHTGIVLSDAKKDMVYSRLSKRIRQNKLGSFDRFCAAIEQGDAEECEFLINAITTNLTAFFREKHHFDYLSQQLVPALLQQHDHDKRIRIWSAGCSTGEEPYSLAITLYEAVPDIDKWDIKILATDLDANVIEHAKQAVYQIEKLQGVNEKQLQRWFKRGSGNRQGMVKVRDEIKQMITFKRLNLLHNWPMRGPFDVIFCRNVVIYFDKTTQKLLFQRYAEILKPHGHLFIGHSESLYKVSERFRALGHTIYQRLD